MLKKAILFIIDGMDTVNFTMGNTPVMNGLHGKTAVGIAHTEIIGAGTTITPIAHGMMGTGRNIVAPRPGRLSSGRPIDYYGIPAETIGDIARQSGMQTAAVGKNEAAIVLGGLDEVDHLLVESSGVDATDHRVIIQKTAEAMEKVKEGIIVINYNGVDAAGHNKDIRALIQAVENADTIVGEILKMADIDETLLVIAADHGTNAVTGKHNTAPTPLCLMTGSITGRVNLGIVHNFEIARTITEGLGLRPPREALGRNLLALLDQKGHSHNYFPFFEAQMQAYTAASPKRHQLPLS